MAEVFVHLYEVNTIGDAQALPQTIFRRCSVPREVIEIVFRDYIQTVEVDLLAFEVAANFFQSDCPREAAHIKLFVRAVRLAVKIWKQALGQTTSTFPPTRT